MQAFMPAELQARSHGNSNIKVGRFEQDDALRSTKRYLILTYKAEFDQVLYPLPLCPEDSPTPAFFRSIIKRLQAEVQEAVQVLTLYIACALGYCVMAI